MSYPVFYVPAGDVLPVMFASYDGATGASEAISGLSVADIEIYKDGSVTQRASDAGYTLLDTDGIDFDGLTGINGFSIDTGDNTDASFYTVGAWFTVVVSSITADAQTVNFIACQFRIMPAESVAGKPKVDTDTFGGTAGTFASGRPEVNTTHAAGTAWGSGAITAASIASDAITAAKVADGAIDAATFAAGAINAAAIASDAITAAKIADGAIDAATFAAGAINAAAIAADAITAAKVAADVTTEIQNGLATAANLATANAALVTIDGKVDTVDANVDAILADTNDIQTRIPAALVSGRMDASVGSVAVGAIDAAATSADFIAEINATVDTAISDAALATAADLATVDTVVDAVKAKTDSLTFTSAGQVDANIQSVNDVELTGDGNVTPWGPA